MHCLNCGPLRACTCVGGLGYGIGETLASALSGAAQASNARIGAIAAQAQYNAIFHSLTGQCALSAAAYQYPSGLGQSAMAAAGMENLGHISRSPLRPLDKAGTTFGEMIGWRIWPVRHGYLASYSANYVWTPDMAAEGAPGDYDGGGLWAFKTAGAALNKLLSQSETSAMGSVYLYGEVVEHSEGYRAQYASVRSIDELHSRELRSPHVGTPRETREAILAALRETYIKPENGLP